MKVAAYVRVSTIEQAQEGYSLDGQKDRVQAFCTSQGWNDVQIYIDDGYTGTNTNRPALKRMIRHIEAKQIQAVVVLKLDRLSRKQKDALYLLEDVFEKNGTIFKSVTEPFDTSTAFGKATIGMLSVFAQLERDMIVERTTAGRRDRTNEGKWYGGRIPYGYSYNKEAELLEVVPEEAAIIREIYTRYLQGMSRLSIAEWAAPRITNRVVDHTTIRDFLSRPIYMGKLTNADMLVDGNHEAIIEPEEWFKVQSEISKRKEGVSPIGEYLLTGLLKCGVCGSGIVHVRRKTNKKGKDYVYELYACKNQHVRQKERTNNCSLGYFRRAKIEEFVIDSVKRLSADRKKLKTIFDSIDTRDNGKVSSALQIKMDSITEQLDNLYDAIQSGAIKAAAVGSRIAKLEEDRESISRQMDDVQEHFPKVVSTEEMSNMLKQISDLWEELTDDERKIVIRQAVLGVTLKPEEDHEITWNILR